MMYKYTCPDCRITLTTAVKPIDSPTHPCPRHVNKTKCLTLVESEEKDKDE
jgi:hypothetical protein